MDGDGDGESEELLELTRDSVYAGCACFFFFFLRPFDWFSGCRALVGLSWCCF